MKRLSLILLAVLTTGLLVACDPPAIRASVGQAICALGQHGDPATLSLGETGFTFDPAGIMAFNVVAYAGGTDLASREEAASEFRDGLAFFSPEGIDTADPLNLELTGSDRSVSIAYYRQGITEPLYCRIRE